MTVKTTIKDGPVSDFMLNVPYPKSNQHHDIEWKSPAPPKLLKPYKESGDARIFSRRKIAPKSGTVVLENKHEKGKPIYDWEILGNESTD